MAKCEMCVCIKLALTQKTCSCSVICVCVKGCLLYKYLKLLIVRSEMIY